MTLGNMRSLGVRSLAVSCMLCHHAAHLGVDDYADDVTVTSFGPRMVCTSCGIIGADARPNWRKQTERHDPDGHAMAKLKMPAEAAAALRVSERMLLFCVASNTDWKHTAIPGEIVTTMVVKGLIERDTGGHLALTDRGRAVLRAMLPDL